MDIAIIATYRAQVSLIQKKILNPDIEISTVDAFQGRDKSLVLYSCTRTEFNKQTKTILDDPRRLNVALTRAKHKIVFCGYSKALRLCQPYQLLLSNLAASQMVTLQNGILDFDWNSISISQ